jgi:predicted RNA-binding protein (virulence factor B family)
VKLGEYNELRIDRFTSPGAYLEDEEGNDVLLPTKYIDPSFKIDDMVNVFLYKDSEGRIIATTRTPYLTIGQFAVLRIAEVNQFGAFAEWGVEKHLLIPFKEQPKRLEEGKYYLIHLYIDDATQRLVGTTRVKMYLYPADEQLERNQNVELLVCEKTELGVKVIVNHRYNGLIFHSDVHKQLRMGDKLPGFIKNIRPDGRLDIALFQEGYDKIEGLARKFMQLLSENEGFLYLTDKSTPEEIREVTGWSKKIFKQVVGHLYKQQLIMIHDNGITFLEQEENS